MFKSCKKGKHKLKVIYDYESYLPDGFNLTGYTGFGLHDLIERMKIKKSTYVKTICIKCGKIFDERGSEVE
ncbi:MAG: hypothetical protein AMJ43_07860 [Coxiella sp. DG_40]|nr:MAG: hypothetical protein AMJ43_07860 [Coxiella sp. DG_40]